jgi:hypothetical protein
VSDLRLSFPLRLDRQDGGGSFLVCSERDLFEVVALAGVIEISISFNSFW